MALWQKKRKLGYLILMPYMLMIMMKSRMESRTNITPQLFIINHPSMRRIFKNFLKGPDIPGLQLCPHHPPQIDEKKPVIPTRPYSTDHCLSCQTHICHSCSENHVAQYCQVELGINKQLGIGVERALNLGDLIKVEIDSLKCICGKALGSGAAICAACGMASCSQACHKEWEAMGNCSFMKLFFSYPETASMRSILFSNIYKLREAKMKEWSIANRSSTSMVCAYTSSKHDYIFLQRGYRNYGRVNDQLLSKMEEMPRTIDYYIHYDRRCECTCQSCANRPVHSSNNCQSTCSHFHLEYMKRASLKPEVHKQCTCTCQFCNSGLVVVTHRYIDCMPFCKRSQLRRDNQTTF